MGYFEGVNFFGNFHMVALSYDWVILHLVFYKNSSKSDPPAYKMLGAMYPKFSLKFMGGIPPPPGRYMFGGIILVTPAPAKIQLCILIYICYI